MSIQNQAKEQRDNEDYSRNFSRIPNMIFLSYKYLSKEEKYLYCALKSIYWDAKPRYCPLREIAEKTGYSVGALSKMLPRLHKCGLIHAEVKREKGKDGKEKGNAKYHITILDIWELNRQFFSCPLNERDLLDPSLVLVHEKTQTCSPNEQACSPHEHVCAVNQGVESADTPSKDILKMSFKEREKETEQPPVRGTHKSDVSLSLPLEKTSSSSAERVPSLHTSVPLSKTYPNRDIALLSV
jgi:hypothetical protein